MIERRLQRHLILVARRLQQLRLSLRLAVVWMVLAIAGGLAIAMNFWAGFYLPHAAIGFGVMALVAAAIVTWHELRRHHDYQEVAQKIESAYPELNSALLAAIEQRPELPHRRYGFLQDSVIKAALYHGYQKTWSHAVPSSQLWSARLANLAAFVVLAGVLVAWTAYAKPRPLSEVAASESELPMVSGELAITVEPGDTEVERGTSLLVSATFPGRLPYKATLVFNRPDGKPLRLPMSKSLDDPVFAARVSGVDAPSTYRVEFSRQSTAEYRVGVFEHPALVRADAQLKFPEYTGQSERVVQDIRTVSAVEGSRVTLQCFLNKAVDSARLIPVRDADDNDEISLRRVERSDGQILYEAEMTLAKSKRFELKLTDLEQRDNKRQPEFVFNVLANKPPDLKLVLPSRDVQVSPLEELEVKANAWDDYGLRRYGLSFSMAGKDPKELVLGEDVRGKQRVDIGHLVNFESLKAAPDQLLVYHFWAEDTGPNGDIRRTLSDMFFAEVRHFEEIFRQGQQPPGGSQPRNQQPQGQPGGGNRQTAQLVELQKQIINATWKLIRRETGPQLGDDAVDDVRVLVDSQGSALEQATAAATQVEDFEAKSHISEVTKQMMRAFQGLQSARDGATPEPLKTALGAEQSAYQALLKLRAREHQVVRGNQRQQPQRGQQGGGGGNRSRQQLQQLQLKNDANRYETERAAQAQQETADQETRQVLDRLRELARRQGDLNKRLKELQSALEEAQTEEEQEDIKRQLKRLREEQEQILRDTDDLRSQMEQPQNQERMADSRQQLEQTRENLRRASEAMDQGRASQAAAAGTRAERNFEEARDDVRRQVANRFEEEMREMRQQARELDDQQQDLSQRLGNLDKPNQAGSLRSADQREEVQKGLETQQRKLSDLLDRMRQTVLDAETAEPLVADKLYDAAREAQHQQLEQTLEQAGESMRRGLLEDAQGRERTAKAGIRQLRNGVEQAAKSVLGDEAEALRRAEAELDELARQLQGELEQNDPSAESRNPAKQRGNRETSENPPGERRNPSQKPGDEQASDRQAGQRSQANNEENESKKSNRRRSGQKGNGQATSNQRQQGDSEPQSPRAGDPRQEGGDRRPDRAENSQKKGNQRGRAGAQGGRQTDPGDDQKGRRENRSQPGNEARDGRDSQRQPGGGLRAGNPNAAPNLGADWLGPLLDRMDAPYAPLTGEDFRAWSDRLRDVEEMMDDAELRAEAARIRDRARGIRIDVKRHSKEPNWDLVRLKVLKPLVELRDRVSTELLRRTAKNAKVPIDGDPVPPEYEDQVRRYYERLGKGANQERSRRPRDSKSE